MPGCLKIFFAACFYYGGLVKLARCWARRSGQSLFILNYHRAYGGDLRAHFLYLRRHYRILHLEAALEELYMLHKGRARARDLRPLLAITFDDGYLDNYIYAVPLACELQIPITIFLVPGYIESGNSFWWLAGNQLVQHAQVAEVSIEGKIYHLSNQEERKALAQAIDDDARSAVSVAEREVFLRDVRAALAVPSSETAEEKLALPLTWAQVQEMRRCEWVSFGAHTMDHPVLSRLSDPAEVRHQVKECRAVLEEQLGRRVRIFAYPIGLPDHIGDSGFRAVREAGYDYAVTTIRGFNTPGTHPYLLRRLGVAVNQHWLVMAAEISGVWSFFSRYFGFLRRN